MAAQHIEAFKREVKKEFSRRKKTEEGLKLGQVYNDMAKKAGHKDWNTYRSVLEKMR